MLKAGDHAQGSGFAAATGAEQGKELSVANLERDVVDSDDRAIGAPFGARKPLHDVPDLYGATMHHGHTSRRQEL